MATGLDYTGMVPGIDFLQNLVKGAGAAMPGVPGLGAVPGMGQWVMPTLDPAELEKRISELRTVQFWLEQNAKLLGATIQAMEVQRMTLSTLQGLNVSMADLRDAMSIKTPGQAAPSGSASAPAPAFKFVPDVAAQPEPEPPLSAESSTESTSGFSAEADTEPASTPAAGAPPVDPMKWWGALTQQFTEIAGQAMRASAAEMATTAAAASAQQARSTVGANAGPAVRTRAAPPASPKARRNKSQSNSDSDSRSDSQSKSQGKTGAPAKPTRSAQPGAAAKKKKPAATPRAR